MAKPDPALLDPTRYPFACEIATRFGDLDVNMHINNVALAGICEDGRVRFHKASGYHAALGGAGGVGAMVASFAIEYLGQAFYPAPVTVHVAAERLGGTSYSLVQLIRQGDRTAAFTRATMVVVKDDRPAPIPELFRTSVAPWMLQA
ncbi:MAG: acyl-CoA thioesterase [Novosphingobium sp.]|nr:acyl-CoA thioesterase [Novosphingobium sp.]